jgi:hypothetical protein
MNTHLSEPLKIDPRLTRISRYFDEHPPRSLTEVERSSMNWARTDSAPLEQLFYQYLTKGVRHGFQLARLLESNSNAKRAVIDAASCVVVGPGFGDEVDLIEDLGIRNSQMWAVEINENAHPVLRFERDFLRIVNTVDALPVLAGPVVFFGVHVLRQPLLANDQLMSDFAKSLLRVAPDGFTFLSTLPNSYGVESKFRSNAKSETLFPDRIDADDLLAESLCELGVIVDIQTDIFCGIHSARLTTIRVYS